MTMRSTSGLGLLVIAAAVLAGCGKNKFQQEVGTEKSVEKDIQPSLKGCSVMVTESGSKRHT